MNTVKAKSIRVLLTSLLATLGLGLGNAHAVTCYVDPAGTYIEAENYTSLTDGSGPGIFRVQSTEPYANGNSYLFSDRGSTNEPPENQRANYQVLFNTTGTYYVWIRGFALNGSSDSVFVGLDGTYVGAINENGYWYQWVYSKTTQMGVNTINVASTGTHTLNVWVREGNHKLDGIYVTTNSGNLPGGIFPSGPTHFPDGAKILDPKTCKTDAVAPSQITNLAIGTTTNESIQLTWTAPGDDGNVGTATSYEIRYLTDQAVIPQNWAAATTLTGLPAPQVAGTNQSYTAYLPSNGTYYFAIRANDEEANQGAVSNSVNTTIGLDGGPPNTVSNLATGGKTDATVQLTWSAPGDSGTVGRATAYDIRYRTGGAVSDANWATATQVPNEPAPQAYGATESFWVTDLNPSTTYYFGLKAVDEVSNWSALSNSPSTNTDLVDSTPPAATTDLATTTPSSQISVTLTWTAPGDSTNTGTATSYDVRYSTSTITTGNWASATQASGEPAPQLAGNTEVFTVSGLAPGTTYYFALKTSDEVPNISGLSNVVSKATLNVGSAGVMKVHPSGAATGDTTSSYSGGTAATAMDTKDNDSSYARLNKDSTNTTRAALDDPVGVGSIISVRIRAYIRDADGSSSDNLRIGLKIGGVDYWGSTIFNISNSYALYSGTQYYTNPNSGAAWTWANINSLEANVQKLTNNGEHRITELWAEIEYSETDTTAPAAVSNLSVANVTNSTARLTWTEPGDDGSSGVAKLFDIRYSTSPVNDANWATRTQVVGEPIPTNPGGGAQYTVTALTPLTIYYFAIRTRDEVPNISALSNVASTTTLEAVPPSTISNLAAVTTGEGSVQLSWTAPGDDGMVGTATSYDIRYQTGSAINDTNWGTATVVASPPAPLAPGNSQNFTVTGLYQNTTYYFAIKTADEVPNSAGASNSPSATTIADVIPPADIANLTILDITSNLAVIRWTAPGDNGNTGTATTYDIRYYTSPITSNNWISAFHASGEPAPAVAGTVQQMTVAGLIPNRTYYFAMTTDDEVPNKSNISNQPTALTEATDTRVPSAITNLAVITSLPSQTATFLKWTAPGDDGAIGTATTYDIRYSTATITSGNWATATQATSEPTPLIAGTQQTFKVQGLQPATLYYFAIKTIDDNNNTSELSNVVSYTTVASGNGGNLAIYPSGAATGNSAGFTGTVATALDTNDGNTSYGSLSNSSTQKLMMDFDNPAAGTTIRSVQVTVIMRESSSRTNDQVKIGLKTNGVEFYGPILNNISTTTWETKSSPLYATNPQTGAAWSWTDVNNLIGLVANVNGSGSYRVTQMFASVVYGSMARPLETGWNMLSIPTNLATEDDFEVLFSSDLGQQPSVYEWVSARDPAHFTGAYQVAGSVLPGIAENGSTLGAIRGFGYWMYSNDGKDMIDDEFNGEDMAECDPVNFPGVLCVDVTLQVGGNMIGNPYLVNKDMLNSAHMKVCNATLTPGCTNASDWKPYWSVSNPDNAVQNVWLDNIIYYYTPSTSQYDVTQSTTDGTMVLEAWKAYWLRVETGGTIKLRFYR
ncbi:MAG: Ig-like domain-containing protein [Gammaproteobacteria bacterium]|nr:MAG: Ig-like domain-containing protein [Gammaproteobacteria bacterium]TND07140.1 MAG: Ig-like domain-containing protein [Gammaproteobacteria bacterium]